MFGSPDELIVAAATASGGGLRAIVRIAGADTKQLLSQLFEPVLAEWPQVGEPATCVPVVIQEPLLARDYGRLLCDVLFWPGPSGPLGGPLAEVQLPGSPPLVADVIAATQRHGCRLAKGGEFSLRSFLAGRIDLVQAEAVLAVIDARSPTELTAALDAAAGGIGKKLEMLRDSLLDLLGDVEAMIDFGDEVAEGRGPGTVEAELAGRLASVLDEVSAMEIQLQRRAAEVSAGLPRVVLAGAANVGKSSLFNAFVGQAKALVADQPGTTRDWLEAEIEGPQPFVLVDLAGFEDTLDRQDAVAAAVRELTRADLVIDCCDAAKAGEAASAMPAVGAQLRLAIWTRGDCGGLNAGLDGAHAGRLVTSSQTGAGIALLRSRVEEQLARLEREGSPATLRIAAALTGARVSGQAGLELLADRNVLDEALLAAELGRMLASLDDAIGRDLGNDLLDRIFSRHCIGK
jgi:tRNA modification GTPase